MQENALDVSRPAPHICQIVLNRPSVANAFNTAMATELGDIFAGFDSDINDTRAVLLTGAGDRAFCAGADLKERQGMTDAQWAEQHVIYERMVRELLACPIPVIGAINGAAYAGGCELAAATDITFAARHARFAQTETRIGIIPGIGGTQTLARKIGTNRAMELILSARPFSAEEAHQWGLVNALFDGQDLIPAAMELAQKIAANAPLAVQQAKVAITRGSELPLPEAMALEVACYNQTFATEDRHEGVNAFNEKRPPRFKGR